MPLRTVRAATSMELWDACLEAWLSDTGHSATGPHTARLWLTHTAQRDAALKAAQRAGSRGWFDPPLHFLSELRELFQVRGRPIGVLTGRLLLARIARQEGERLGLGPMGDPAPARSHLLDGLIGELLAEGVEPDDLASALDRLEGDDFATARNAWVTATYRAFRSEIDRRGLYDPRQIHALVASRVEVGGLPEALGGAVRLHVYGLTSLSHRQRLFRALAEQPEVDVAVYLLDEPEDSEWDVLSGESRIVPTDAGPPRPEVRVASSALDEAELVARQVKQELAGSSLRPSDVAIVVRTGREDAHLFHRALLEAGIPSSARLRNRLSEIPALRAILSIFSAAGEDWTWRHLREVATSPYFDFDLDPRPLDEIATRRRVRGLGSWLEALSGLAGTIEAAPDHPETRNLLRRGLTAARVEHCRERLSAIASLVPQLEGKRGEAEWVSLTRRLTRDGEFGFRRRVCIPAGERYDIVRTDQRAVVALDGLLAEWEGLVGEGPPFDAAIWHTRLRRLLESNELALTDPAVEGVHILEAHEAALTPFARVFLVHANEGEFPRPPRVTGVFTERERTELRASGLPVADRESTLRRERTLWRAVTAGRAVTISFRAATPIGTPLLPSLMLSEAGNLTGAQPGPEPGGGVHVEHAVRRDELLLQDIRQLSRTGPHSDAEPVPVSDVSLVRQGIVTAFAEQVRSGRLDDTPGVERMLGLAAVPVLARDQPPSERPHPWGGCLRDPLVLEWIGQRFGPARHWSAGELQQYAVRPFDFFIARVLGIEIRAEAGEETSPLASGSVAHAVLERLYAPLVEGTADVASLQVSFDATCEAVFEEIESGEALWLGLPDLWRLRRDELRETLRAFVAWDARRLERTGVGPTALEVSFGGENDRLDLSGPDLHGREAVLLVRGRIDRVEGPVALGPATGVRLVDYKVGNPPPQRAYDDGAALQGALYAAAWSRLTGAAVAEAVYLSLSKPGAGSRSGLRGQQVEGLMKLVRSIPARVRGGLFEPVQAASIADPAPWQPGPEVTRTAAHVGSGHRFETPPGRADG